MIKRGFRHKIALVFLFIFIIETFFPPIALALTSGPTQPEFQKFTPASATDMVNMFSGDMSYNIPLFELPGPNGGYPFNLSYTSGVTMEQEASWVGLGWDLNVGAMNRSMRGIPDEFDGSRGDNITVREDMKKNFTVGLSYTPDFEIFSKDVISFGSVSVFFNNYKGIGYSIGFGVNVKAFSIGNAAQGGLGLDVTMNTQEGVDISPNLSLSAEGDKLGADMKLGATFNSIEGYKGLGVTIQVKKTGERMEESSQEEEAPVDDMSKMFKEGGIVERDEKKDEAMGLGANTNAEPSQTQKVPVKYVQYQKSAGFHFGYTATPSVMPSINSETEGFATNINVKIGAEAYGGHPDIEAGGFYRQEKLVKKNEDVDYPVYGYNHSGKASKNSRALMDFNREGDGSINKYTKSLAIPSYTYDTWSITGQGIGQMVRPHKSYVGFVRDPERTSKIRNMNVGVDIGGGNLVKGGGSGGFSSSTSKSGAWGNLNNGSSFANNFANFEIQKTGYEPYFYKVHGELVSYSQQDFQKYTAGTSPMRLKRKGLTSSPLVTSIYEDLDDSYVEKSGQERRIENIRKERAPRSNFVLEVNNEMLNTNYSSFKEFFIQYYNTINNYSAKTTLNRNNTKNHHIAGFVAYKNDGLRYVYALPVLNKKHIESSFSVKASASEVNNGGNGYTLFRNQPTSEYQLYKEGGVFSPQRLNVTSTPEYAHCFPLTSVLGVDYVDVKNDGITDDDLGYWVKFGYYKDNGLYKWRMPYSGFNYSPGMLSTPSDDMGSYIYGERENYYLQTAETKTHIAKFYLQPRLDNLPAASRNNFEESPALPDYGGYYISRIELFSKAELRANPLNPVPIKTVYFNYDYTLCPEIKNKKSGGVGTGKLTLREVYFKYRNNERATHNKYRFNYYMGDHTDVYNSYAQDIWGTYKKLTGDFAENFHFPYVRQSDAKSVHDRNASMWNLNQLELPSGAIIDIEYEMDDYTYVQNKPAMQLYKLSSATVLNNNRKVYFELSQPYPKPDDLGGSEDINSRKEVQKYMKGFLDKSGYIYFKAKIDIDQGGSFEYVSGYAQVDLSNNQTIQLDAGSYNSAKGGYTRGILTLKQVKVKDKTFNDHPFSVASWNYLQLNRPDLIGGIKTIGNESDADPSKAMIREMLFSLVTPFKGIGVFINGFYGTCRNKSYGTNIKNQESYIRLNSQNSREEIIDTHNNTRKIENFKYGGGHRVKKVILRESVTTPVSDAVGVVYDYAYHDGEKWKSSGVATFEPSLGGEENALKLPLEFEVDVKIRANYKLFTEMPFNQALYPSASVGYGQVTVRSYATDRVLSKDLSAEIPTTGQSVYKFYTAKDFPVITDYTKLHETSTKKSETFYAYLYTSTKDYFRGTQGFSIELNDMHGKPKSIEAFAISQEGKIIETPISGTYYNYKSRRKSNINGYDAMQLVNDGIDVIDENGKQYTNYIVGLDYEIINDVRESVSMGYSGSIDVNVDVFMAGIIPIVIPIIMPKASVTESVVQSAVTNKVFYRTGIIDETIQMTDGAKVSARTKLVDKLTGLPVVQTISNEYGNIIETSNYPGYWHYEEMGPVYKRIGTTINTFGVQSGNILVADNTDNFFKEGDEVNVVAQFDLRPQRHQWRATIHSVKNGKIYLESPLPPSPIIANRIRCEMYLYRPIERNQLDAMIGSTTILKK